MQFKKGILKKRNLKLESQLELRIQILFRHLEELFPFPFHSQMTKLICKQMNQVIFLLYNWLFINEMLYYYVCHSYSLPYKITGVVL